VCDTSRGPSLFAEHRSFSPRASRCFSFELLAHLFHQHGWVSSMLLSQEILLLDIFSCLLSSPSADDRSLLLRRSTSRCCLVWFSFFSLFSRSPYPSATQKKALLPPDMKSSFPPSAIRPALPSLFLVFSRNGNSFPFPSTSTEIFSPRIMVALFLFARVLFPLLS